MSVTDRATRFAACTNVSECTKAVASEAVEWYPGAGEYCPECGEALTPLDAAPSGTETSAAAIPSESAPVGTTPVGTAPLGTTPPGSSPLGSAPAAAAAPAPPAPRPPLGAPAGRPPNLGRPPRPHRILPVAFLRWFWTFIAVLAAGGAIMYTERRPIAAQRQTPDVIAVCPISSARQLAADLVRGFVAHSGTSPNRFVLRDGNACDVRFSTTRTQPEAVIARDGVVAIVNPLNPISRITEQQLRGIFTGSIRNWAQLGGPYRTIVAIMTDEGSDEAKLLASTLFLGAGIGRAVQRATSSADVTRAVAGADRRSRDSIGLVAFSQSVPAKVLPLAYLPPPSVLTIGTLRYPYTLTIAVELASLHTDPAAADLVDYARSNAGAEIVAKDGLVGGRDF